MDVPAQGKECFSTGRASSARDQSRSPPNPGGLSLYAYMYAYGVLVRPYVRYNMFMGVYILITVLKYNMFMTITDLINYYKYM
jgi:hypothetical protein